MVMQVMRKGRFSGVIKVGFLTLLTLGTCGLVLSDVRGVLSGSGVGSNDVGAVGGEKISLVSFDRMLSRTLRQIGFSPEEAYQAGYTQQILGQELRNRTIEIAARKNGVELSRPQIAQQVAKIIDPIAGDKGNKQEILEQVLRAQGLSENEFVRQVGQETASSLLTQALTESAVPPTEALLRDLYTYENESRDIELIALPNSAFALAKEPDDAALKTAYEGLKENFAIPESRDISLLIIDDAALKAKVDIPEEELKRLYDEDKASYTVPETRKVEQALLKDEDKAREIAKLASAGTPLKDAVKKVTGAEKGYVGDIDFEKTATQAELRDLVFNGKETGKVLGPVKTPLGYHVMIVKKITPQAQLPFGQVKDKIKKDQLDIKASDQVYEASAQLDDLLASSTPVDEIKTQVPLKIVSLKDVSMAGQGAGNKALMADYKNDAPSLLQNAFEMEEGESSPVNQLKDGRYYAVHVDKITAKTYKPFEDIKAQLKTQTIAVEKAEGNRKQAKALLERLDKGEITLSALSEELKKPIKSLPGLKKSMNKTPDPLIPSTLGFVFAAKEKEPFLLDIKDGVALAVVTHTNLPATPDKKDLDALAEKIAGQSQNEILGTYTGVKMKEYGAKINESLLHQIYGRSATDTGDYGG
ncbi:MAG: peptidyl-prolyl cis-trans isomerase [Alphaproteobacteria bacterium]|nr:peptidyl-prolyl cis-trans isomerase [Alphaproteobacteria bacterium]